MVFFNPISKVVGSSMPCVMASRVEPDPPPREDDASVTTDVSPVLDGEPAVEDAATSSSSPLQPCQVLILRKRGKGPFVAG